MTSLLMRGAIALGATLFLAGNAIADDWTADKLRGQVLQLVDGQWQPLLRGDVVSDARVIRTLTLGYVEFTRGAETINLGPNTQIQIHDEAGTKPFTTVKQYFGEVAVEAEVENVQHFAVQTPFLAAVVKGTKFVVTSGQDGARVDVNRGHVAVVDYATHEKVTVSVGQSASVGGKGHEGLAVSGTGELPTVTKVVIVSKPKHSDASSGSSDDAAAGTDDSDDDNPGKGKSDHGNSDHGNSGHGNSGNGNNSGHGNSGNGNSANAPGHNKSDDNDQGEDEDD